MLIELSDWKRSEAVGSCSICDGHFNAEGGIHHDVVELKLGGAYTIRLCNKALWKYLIDADAIQLRAVDLLTTYAFANTPEPPEPPDRTKERDL